MPETIPDPVLFIDPVRRGRSVYTESRLAVFPSGNVCTVLAWLAWKKYNVKPDAWEDLGLLPFWRDGNSKNETVENVDLAATVKIVRDGKRDFPDVLKTSEDVH